jgi:hypothetical protein
MRELLRRAGKPLGRLAARLTGRPLGGYDWRKIEALTAVGKGAQMLLAQQYRELARAGAPRPAFRDVEFRCFSQTGEDGILLYLFALLGTTNRKCVEVCAGDGIECNTANLIVNHGWDGLLFDGNPKNVRRGRRFYAKCPETFVRPPTFVEAWITAENINALLRENGAEGDIDLLSLDLDGVDYWIWEAIDCVRPRVVVVECRPEWGPEKTVTVPYRPDFATGSVKWPWYGGASLPAFVKLGREKGYRLVGAIRHGFNAFFVRDGVGEELLPEVPPGTVTSADPKRLWPEHLWSDPGWAWVEV